MRLIAICFTVLFMTAPVSAAEPVTLLAKPIRLLFDDDGTIARGGKKTVKLNKTATLRAWAGAWEKHEGAWRSTWKPGMGHSPVAAYDMKPLKNLIVEVTFRYGEMTEAWHHQCFRIALDNRNLYTGHILSVWANPNNDFIETGLLLQHIRKKADKTIVSDLLLDRQPLQVKPSRWYTATLEVVGNEALFRMGDHIAWSRLDELDVEKTKVSLTLGTTWHEIRRVRAWEATANPAWAKQRDQVLKRRNRFEPQPHAYKKVKEK
jgi:hypothetical protein